MRHDRADPVMYVLRRRSRDGILANVSYGRLGMSRQSALARQTLAMVLAGGNGTRLGGLTRSQCKPAVPFAGHFRNIDFTLSNCVNSQVRRIGVLTQYKAQSLIDHITSSWNFLPRHLGEFVDVWPAQQRLHSKWYAGTADAVYQNIDLILAQGTKYSLVLAGDHIYKMDYRRMLEQHAASGADVTIACLPVPVEQASGFGILDVDAQQRVRTFTEKPAPATLDVPDGYVLASMGIYVFNTEYLLTRLERDARTPGSTRDFGRDILPAAVSEDQVAAFRFVDASGKARYWRDVGTLDAYWQAHMELLTDEPGVDLYDPQWPIWTQPLQLAPARFVCDDGRGGVVANSMLSAGTKIRGAVIRRSVLGTNVEVEERTLVEESVVLPGARIGANCRLRRVIVDSDTRIPAGTMIDGSESHDACVTLLTRESIFAMTPDDLADRSGSLEAESTLAASLASTARSSVAFPTRLAS